MLSIKERDEICENQKVYFEHKKDSLRNQLIIIAASIIPLFAIFNQENAVSFLKISIISFGVSLIFGIASMIFEFIQQDIAFGVSSNAKKALSMLEKNVTNNALNEMSKVLRYIQKMEIYIMNQPFSKLALYFFAFQIITFLFSIILILIFIYKF